MIVCPSSDISSFTGGHTRSHEKGFARREGQGIVADDIQNRYDRVILYFAV